MRKCSPSDKLQLTMTEKDSGGHFRPEADQQVANYTDLLLRRIENVGSSPDSLSSAYTTFETSNSLVLAEHIIRTRMGEELNAIFVTEPLEDLDAFMVSETGSRRIVTREGLDAASRVFFYLHYLGHLARGHIHPTNLDIQYEYKNRNGLPIRTQEEEMEADEWVLKILTNRPAVPSNAFATELRTAILHKLEEIQPKDFKPILPARMTKDITQLIEKEDNKSLINKLWGSLPKETQEALWDQLSDGETMQLVQALPDLPQEEMDTLLQRADALMRAIKRAALDEDARDKGETESL